MGRVSQGGYCRSHDLNLFSGDDEDGSAPVIQACFGALFLVDRTWSAVMRYHALLNSYCLPF